MKPLSRTGNAEAQMSAASSARGAVCALEFFASLRARVAIGAILLAGLLLRLFFIWRYPYFAGDTKFYSELARNWLWHRVYGLFIQGQLLPVDQRMPGYPAFLAGIYALCGQSGFAVRVVQALVDLATCVLTAVLAAQLAPRGTRARSRIFFAALLLSSLCVFTASYTAAILSETLATFFTCAALLCLTRACAQPQRGALQRAGAHGPAVSAPTGQQDAVPSALRWWFLAGLLAGLGALVRPETPIVFVPFLLLLLARSLRRTDWRGFALFSSWAAVGLLCALTPWAARNARTLGRIQFLVPPYANAAGDFIPTGFHNWTRTWLVRYRDAYEVIWKLNHTAISPDDLPPPAFDSPQERAAVFALLHDHNATLKMTPLLDHSFSQIAAQRTRRNPLRTYLWVPLRRISAMWLTPRVDVLRYQWSLWPPPPAGSEPRPDFWVAWAFELAQIFYLALALWGAWKLRRNPLAIALLAYVALRTVLLTPLPTVEPRYVVECFPALIALAAQVWVPSPHA